MDKQLRQQQQGLLQEIEKSQLSYDDWSYLSGLIGSAEGDKFRRYAQGLTLDCLVSLANQQLDKLHEPIYYSGIISLTLSCKSSMAGKLIP